MRIVCVKWVDSAGLPNSWQHTEDLPEFSCSECVSVGFVLEETDEFIALSAHIADIGDETEGINGTMVIPKCSISSVVDIWRVDDWVEYENCFSCKHKDCDPEDTPCVECRTTGWEPEEDEDEAENEDEDRMCYSCKHVMRNISSVHCLNCSSEHCLNCLGTNDKPNWEPEQD